MITVTRLGTTSTKDARLLIGYSFHAREIDLHSVIPRAMERIGAELKEGEAPFGLLERELIRLFEIGDECGGAVV